MTAESLKPLAEAIAELDTPEAKSDRRRRALKRAKDLVGEERNRLITNAGRYAVNDALAPLTRVHDNEHITFGAVAGQIPAAREGYQEAAAAMAGRNIDTLVQRELEAQLRIEDEQAIHADPDRQEHAAVWAEYNRRISAAARAQGGVAGYASDAVFGGEREFVAKVVDLLQDRFASEEVGDSTARVDKQLERLGVPYPAVPDAAWAVADSMYEPERSQEYERLTAKYGSRAGTEPAATSRRRTRK